MSNLFENMTRGAMVGGTIGKALDVLMIGGATVVAGPVGLAMAAKAAICKEAAGTLIGSGVGVVKTIVDERKRGYYYE